MGTRPQFLPPVPPRYALGLPALSEPSSGKRSRTKGVLHSDRLPPLALPPLSLRLIAIMPCVVGLFP
jgi:hypothetical protein